MMLNKSVYHIIYGCNSETKRCTTKSLILECDINEESFILGINKNKAFPEILSFILLYAKYYIYTTRCKKQNLFLGVFKKKLLLMYKIHLEISISNDKLNKFVEKWNPFQNLINSI